MPLMPPAFRTDGALPALASAMAAAQGWPPPPKMPTRFGGQALPKPGR